MDKNNTDNINICIKKECIVHKYVCAICGFEANTKEIAIEHSRKHLTGMTHLIKNLKNHCQHLYDNPEENCKGCPLLHYDNVKNLLKCEACSGKIPADWIISKEEFNV